MMVDWKWYYWKLGWGRMYDMILCLSFSHWLRSVKMVGGSFGNFGKMSMCELRMACCWFWYILIDFKKGWNWHVLVDFEKSWKWIVLKMALCGFIWTHGFWAYFDGTWLGLRILVLCQICLEMKLDPRCPCRSKNGWKTI